LILIAISDPYGYIIDCNNGHIYASLSDDEWLHWGVVSNNFENFIRSMATIDIQNFQKSIEKNLLKEILALNM